MGKAMNDSTRCCLILPSVANDLLNAQVAQIHVLLPPLLQKILLDDRDRVVERHELEQLPCRSSLAR